MMICKSDDGYACIYFIRCFLELCAANTPDGIGYHIHIAEDLADVHDSLKNMGSRL